MKLVSVLKSDREGKKYMAKFTLGDDKQKTVHFGSATSQTYLDHKDPKKRENYIKRHRVREDFNDPKTAGSLSRWLLWGDSTNLKTNVTSFRKKFDL